MPITANCPGCNQLLSVGDEYAGAVAKCPSCGTAVTFTAPGAAPPPAPAAPPPPAAAPPPGAYQADLAGYQAPPPGPPRDNTELFTILGLATGTFFLFLLLISTFLRWIGRVDDWPGLSGTFFGDGRLVLLFSVLLLAAVGLNFLTRRFLALSMVVAGAFGTFVFMVMLAHIGRFAGAGIIVGLIAAMGVMGACIWTAVRLPLPLEVPGAGTQPAFMRTYGALLGSQTAALVLGLIYLILTVAS
jgi:hypothetical protein